MYSISSSRRHQKTQSINQSILKNSVRRVYRLRNGYTSANPRELSVPIENDAVVLFVAPAVVLLVAAAVIFPGVA
jgi:hypothetical protein